MGTLWHGGTIYTMKQEGDKTEAVYTEAEEIIMTGSAEELKKNICWSNRSGGKPGRCCSLSGIYRQSSPYDRPRGNNAHP